MKINKLHLSDGKLQSKNHVLHTQFCSILMAYAGNKKRKNTYGGVPTEYKNKHTKGRFKPKSD